MSVRTKTIILNTLIGVIALLLIHSLHKTYKVRWSPYAHPAPGNMVDVGGYKLHSYSTGTGKPSVILDAGFGCFSIVWTAIQPQIAQFTHVCSYDRAGLGWSEKSPLTRTSHTMVLELHALLEKQGTPKPYILVGHSFGGIIMQLYANTYPEDVFGLVLVDSSHELIIEKSNEFNKQYYNLLPGTYSYWHRLLQKCRLETVSIFTGIRMHYCYSLVKNGMATLPGSMKDIFSSRLLTTGALYTHAQEAHHIAESHKALSCTKNLFTDKPLIVISRGKGVNDDTDDLSMQAYLTKAHEMVWDPLQKDLVAKSTKSIQIIAEKSGHTIIWSQPELIVSAVKTLVDQYRATLPVNSFS